MGTKQRSTQVYYAEDRRSCNLPESGFSKTHMNRAIFSALTALLALALLAGCRQQTGPSEHINVVMKKYSIDPPVIRIKNGSTVELLVSTADVQHGFDVPKLSIKEPVQPGRTTSIILKAPPRGEYEIVCGIICGPHHDDMGGKLIVE